MARGKRADDEKIVERDWRTRRTTIAGGLVRLWRMSRHHPPCPIELDQVGTNLSMVRLAAAVELWHGKPVIAINAATYWHALRQNGIADKVRGLGRLLESSDFPRAGLIALPGVCGRAPGRLREGLNHGFAIKLNQPGPPVVRSQCVRERTHYAHFEFCRV